jgi:hypothetical protein
MIKAEAAVLKTDKLGRVQMPAERREQLLDEFERSGLSGKKFAALVGVSPSESKPASGERFKTSHPEAGFHNRFGLSFKCFSFGRCGSFGCRIIEPGPSCRASARGPGGRRRRTWLCVFFGLVDQWRFLDPVAFAGNGEDLGVMEKAV